ncbi:MAG: DUF2179 domain-containing protein [Anaerolineales bacterium]|nr:DUF2179 domain-containing protein [Anaerolineales bacterium]
MSPMLTSALLIFALRVVDVSLYTIRFMMVVRGRKGLAWLLAFCKATIYVLAILGVLSNLDNWLNIIGYAAGFATGNIVGMWLEGKLAIGITHLRVISARRGSSIVERLRTAGYAVTEVAGQGRDGMVTILNCGVQRREAGRVTDMIAEIDEQAFITAEPVRLVWRGFWHSA